MKAVVLKDLTYKYEENGDYVLKGLSLEVEEGEFLAVVGKNAGGKSTLAKVINGLIAPLSGEITVFNLDGKDKKNFFEIRKMAGIVFQNPDNQTVASIVEDDVAFGPENIGVPRDEIGERIDFALKATGTEALRNSTASRLSGGQKQRIAIAGVLALRPKILIMDEATSMLDPRGREEVMSVVRKLNKQEKMTVIVITHYMDETTEADRIAVVDDGRVFKCGTPKEIFEDEALLLKAGLELPTSLKIATKLKKKGIDIGQPLNYNELEDKLCEYLQKA